MYSTAASAAQIAERHRDADLHAMAVHEQGRALVRLGRVAEGLGLLDEVMVAVTAGELSPIVTGLMYCSVIDGCQEAHALRRAREWTAALSQWCEQQPEMVSFTGRCLVHRAEIMQLRGSWADALAEAERARERFAQGPNPGAAGEALYRQGEVQRVRGELAAAEDAYREASRCGREPQPGLALLRLAQGRARRRGRGHPSPCRGDHRAGRARGAAARPTWRSCSPSAPWTRRATACRRARGDRRPASAASCSDAVAAQAAGRRRARGRRRPAPRSPPLRRAVEALQELDVPYETARARVLVALACRALGDEDAAALELEAARDSLRARSAPRPTWPGWTTLACGRAGATRTA